MDIAEQNKATRLTDRRFRELKCGGSIDEAALGESLANLGKRIALLSREVLAPFRCGLLVPDAHAELPALETVHRRAIREITDATARYSESLNRWEQHRESADDHFAIRRREVATIGATISSHGDNLRDAAAEDLELYRAHKRRFVTVWQRQGLPIDDSVLRSPEGIGDILRRISLPDLALDRFPSAETQPGPMQVSLALEQNERQLRQGFSTLSNAIRDVISRDRNVLESELVRAVGAFAVQELKPLLPPQREASLSGLQEFTTHLAHKNSIGPLLGNPGEPAVPLLTGIARTSLTTALLRTALMLGQLEEAKFEGSRSRALCSLENRADEVISAALAQPAHIPALLQMIAGEDNAQKLRALKSFDILLRDADSRRGVEPTLFNALYQGNAGAPINDQPIQTGDVQNAIQMRELIAQSVAEHAIRGQFGEIRNAGLSLLKRAGVEGATSILKLAREGGLKPLEAFSSFYDLDYYGYLHRGRELVGTQRIDAARLAIADFAVDLISGSGAERNDIARRAAEIARLFAPKHADGTIVERYARVIAQVPQLT